MNYVSTKKEQKLKLKNGYQEYWLQKQIPILCPALCATKKFFIVFQSSYLAERGFSVITNLLTEKRHRLLIVHHGDLRLLTEVAPNTDKLVSLHQV